MWNKGLRPNNEQFDIKLSIALKVLGNYATLKRKYLWTNVYGVLDKETFETIMIGQNYKVTMKGYWNIPKLIHNSFQILFF